MSYAEPDDEGVAAKPRKVPPPVPARSISAGISIVPREDRRTVDTLPNRTNMILSQSYESSLQLHTRPIRPAKPMPTEIPPPMRTKTVSGPISRRNSDSEGDVNKPRPASSDSMTGGFTPNGFAGYKFALLARGSGGEGTPSPEKTRESKTPHAPSLAKRESWRADSAVKECQDCKEPFTMVLRRHHCRVCGDIFCWECSARRLRHRDKKVRVCSACFNLAKESKERGGMGLTTGMQRNIKQWEQAWTLPNPETKKNNTNTNNKERDREPTVERINNNSPIERQKKASKEEADVATAERVEDFYVYDEEGEGSAIATRKDTGKEKERGKEREKEMEAEAKPVLQREKTVEELAALKQKDDKLRSHIVREILQTEEKYVNCMHAIVQDIIMPLKRTSLTDKEIVGVFLNVEEIVDCHQPLFAMFRERIQDWTDHSCIADIFLSHVEAFWCYSGYYRNYNLKRVGLLLQRPDFKIIKEAFEHKQALTCSLPLEAFLILPVQRIPRYLLFLNDLCKCTSDPSHPDHLPLRLAYEKMKNLLDDLNNSIDPSRMDWLVERT